MPRKSLPGPAALPAPPPPRAEPRGFSVFVVHRSEITGLEPRQDEPAFVAWAAPLGLYCSRGCPHDVTAVDVEAATAAALREHVQLCGGA